MYAFIPFSLSIFFYIGMVPHIRLLVWLFILPRRALNHDWKSISLGVLLHAWRVQFSVAYSDARFSASILKLCFPLC
jgi:hypothetical protein